MDNRVLASTVTHDSQLGSVTVSAAGIAKVVIDFTSLAGDDEGHDNLTYVPAPCASLPALDGWAMVVLTCLLAGAARWWIRGSGFRTPSDA